MRAAREVAEAAQRLGGQAQVHLVWLPVLGSDTAGAAADLVADLAPAPLTSTWLPDRALGHAFAPAIGLKKNRLAWDVVLVFDRKARWEAAPPRPAAWWHQLQGEEPARRMGPELADDLVRAVEALPGG